MAVAFNWANRIWRYGYVSVETARIDSSEARLHESREEECHFALIAEPKPRVPTALIAEVQWEVLLVPALLIHHPQGRQLDHRRQA